MVKKNDFRQRGKKRRTEGKDKVQKHVEDVAFVEDRTGDPVAGDEQPSATASWLLEKRPHSASDDSTPFGLVDNDLKTYLRSAQLTLQERIKDSVEQGRKPNEDEDVKALRNAMLDEIKANELVLATDTDTSVVLEDLLSTFGERQTCLLARALAGECFKLASHRFGSHVLQSLLPALQYYANVQQKNNETKKEGSAILSADQIILDISEALRQQIVDVTRGQFASHVLRTLLCVLSGRPSTSDENRSKRSKRFNAKRVQNAPVELPWSSLQTTDISPPPPSYKLALHALTKTFTSGVQRDEGKDQLRAMCVDPISGPTLASIIELDATIGSGNEKVNGKARGSGFELLDACLDGLMTTSKPIEDRSAHVETLLRDTVGSHVLEVILKTADVEIVQCFWVTYVRQRVTKLGAHPTANFVVATVLRRLNDDAFEEACKEIQEQGEAIVTNRHLGVLCALLERARRKEEAAAAPSSKASQTVWSAGDQESMAMRAVLSVFGILDAEQEAAEHASDEEGAMARLFLSAKTVEERKKDVKAQKKLRKEAKRKRKAERNGGDHGKASDKSDGDDNVDAAHTITLQGSLLCQAIARLHEPANRPLIDSILGMRDVLPIATHGQGVHALLAAIASRSLTFAQRSKMSVQVLEQMQALLNDKFGSRVCDATFDNADVFFRERMAKACLTSERPLLASTYGRFFLLKRVQLGLFRRNLGQWKEEMRVQKQQAQQATAPDAQETQSVMAKGINVDHFTSQRKKQKHAQVDKDLDAILANI